MEPKISSELREKGKGVSHHFYALASQSIVTNQTILKNNNEKVNYFSMRFDERFYFFYESAILQPETKS